MNQLEKTMQWVNEITHKCILEAGGDVDAGLAAAEYILSTYDDEVESIDAYFGNDIYNHRAQAILNKTLKAAKKLSAEARKDLEAALKKNKNGSGEEIINFINKYRTQLASLLTVTQLAAVLEGAREVAKDIPTLATFHGAVPPPPSLEPKEAAALVDKIAEMTSESRAVALYELPATHQTYVYQALAAKEAGGPIIPPTITPRSPLPDDIEGIHFPTIDEAVKFLSDKNVVTRDSYDALDSAARAKSFTVAGVDVDETLTKIRDTLAENVKKGADYETFKKDVLKAVDQGTFMSDAHMETVFRTNVQSAFSDGQMTVLQHPLVRSGFPYSAYDSIHDDRVRHEHLKLDTIGIGGTNIYRNDDPVFQTFRPPWDYNCRCSWTPLTVRQASEAGVEEAKKWLETGIEPAEKAFVKMPDFVPPPSFQRSVSSAPLSIQLSIKSLTAFSQEKDVDYPRDKSNRFIDKLTIAKAARDQDELVKLRESLPENQRWKLDRTVGILRAGGTIYHPKESPGLAINIDGEVADRMWSDYTRALEEYNKWEERDVKRCSEREAVDALVQAAIEAGTSTKFDKSLIAVNEKRSVLSDVETRKLLEDIISGYTAKLDEVDTHFEHIHTTDAQLRFVSRLRRRADVKIANAINAYILQPETFDQLLDVVKTAREQMVDLYEDIAEEIYDGLDSEDEKDLEPSLPPEPYEVAMALGNQATKKNEVIYRFAHFKSKYSDTVILNIKTGIINKQTTTPQVILPQGTQITVVGEDREPDGTRAIIATINKWGGNASMSIDDVTPQQPNEQEERLDLIAGILFSLFGEGAIDAAKELFAKQDDGINAAMGGSSGSGPKVRRRYGRRPGPGWTSSGTTRHGVQIWTWGPNNRTPGIGQQPAPRPSPQQAAPTVSTSRAGDGGSPQQATPPPPQQQTPTPSAQPQQPPPQLRAGGQRARFQSQQAYQLVMAKLNAGQQLTHADKVGLATKLTNMPTPMLRTLYTALGGVPSRLGQPRNLTIQGIRQIISGQSPQQQAQTPSTPQTPQTSPNGMGGIPNPNNQQNTPTNPQSKPSQTLPATQLNSTIPFKDKTTFETGKPQQGVVLNGIPFAPAPAKFWEHVKDVDVKEPPPLSRIHRVSVLVQEPDGRVWIASPTNEFGSRKHTLPGGTVEKGLSNQQNALKEAWEETGLQLEITGYAGDFQDSNYRDTGSPRNGRLYFAKRIGGAPWDAKIESHIISQKTGKASAESEEVHLVTLDEAAKMLHRTDDLAQLATIRPIDVGTPVKGKGSQLFKNLFEAMQPKIKHYNSTKKGDGTLHAAQEMRGFNAKPKVVSKAEMDRLISSGGHFEMLRGLKPTGGKTGSQLANEFREGEHFPGYGCFGNGTYADSTKGIGFHGNRAYDYAGHYRPMKGGSGAIVRIALPKTAKIIKYSDLEKLVPDLPKGFERNSAVQSDLDQWLGTQAALAGYDAIYRDTARTSRHSGYGHGFYAILNRGVLIVQKEDASDHVIS